MFTCTVLFVTNPFRYAYWNQHTVMFRTNSPNIIIQGLQCKGSEHDIYQCSSEPWGRANCTREAVKLNCSK